MKHSRFGKPSLEGAVARANRAKEHLKQLEQEVQKAFLESKGNIAISVAGGTTGLIEDTTDTDSLACDAPVSISILAGEILYNLRSALDYIVHELVRLDCGEQKKHTKFIIDDFESDWNQHLPAYFRGPERAKKKLWLHLLTPSHQATLKALQPFSGCFWTKQLRDLSNPDKHHKLTWIGTRMKGAIVSSNPSKTSFTIPSAIGLPSGVRAEIYGEVAFGDGSPAVESLKEIHKQVIDVIAKFSGDFLNA